MTSELFNPRPSSVLSLLDFPADPLDKKALAELPLRTLQSLTDRVYRQLDSEHPCADALEWYSALAGEWSRRTADGGRREMPARQAGRADHGQQ
ncbi:hypothetical protein [Arthrobacter yangruifuii]|uniref:hypothetical protein n=1 Tax=Arthrobacter yangruifuii TaxID=2606616 RepID=UPI0011B75C4A|nr:hypothetical protein [Arthrobacter yangruifuii]